MAGLCEGGIEPAGSLRAICNIDSQLKMAAPFKRFGEANISEIEFHRAIDVAQSADSLGCCSGAAFGLGLDPPLDFGFFRGFPQPWD
ncbi:hypothetical protein ANN_12338 [Periplaneta americana]|uniref:Per a allergen n=1 Tax=Periplaneta americana TaxID=6978 RepID=A0ABQ8TIG0_PERAM|nr:hypothetical protein ANN_12338 [Periplaneta americana]